MKRVSLLLIVVIILTALAMTSCANSEQREVLSTVRKYVKLRNAEDSAGVFSITHQKMRSIGYKNDLDLQFAIYDVKFKL